MICMSSLYFSLQVNATEVAAYPQVKEEALYVWFVMDTPLPPTHLDECKYTCTSGGTFVATRSLTLPRLM